MTFLMSNVIIPRSKIKRMDFYFTKKKVQDIKDDIKKDYKKERIKELKIKEPVKNTSWNYGDIFTDVKERINELKIKEPVKISSWIDEF